MESSGDGGGVRGDFEDAAGEEGDGGGAVEVSVFGSVVGEGAGLMGRICCFGSRGSLIRILNRPTTNLLIDVRPPLTASDQKGYAE